MKNFARALALAVCVILTGCGVEGDIKKALEKEYNGKELCFFVSNFPRNIVTQSPFGEAAETKIVLALEKEGLLKRGEEQKRGGGAMAMTTAQFTLTSKGEKAYKSGSFCYGTSSLSKLVDIDERGEGSNKYIMAKAVIKNKVTASWAKNDIIKTKLKPAEETVNRRVVKKEKQGWTIE